MWLKNRRSQIEFSGLIIIAALLIISTITSAIFMRENEINLVIGIIKNHADLSAAAAGKKSNIFMTKTRSSIEVTVSNVNSSFLSEISEQVSENINCDSYLVPQGVELKCAYHSYMVKV